MEDSFRVRVDKIFGSLSSSSSLGSFWSLTDEEIERKKWNRVKDDSPEPNPNGFGKKSVHFCTELETDLQDLDDDDVENEPLSRGPAKPDDYDDEEWQIKSSIGLDPTLDYEEEEDEYDKVAVGREKAGDRLYMRDMTDYGAAVDSCNEFANSFEEVTRDPRANHLAAKIRLKEDAEAAKKTNVLRVSGNGEADTVDAQTNSSVDGINVKSILKRKDNQLDSKLEKRVRFDHGCKIVCDEQKFEGAKNISIRTSLIEATVSNKASLPENFNSAVPDYVRNPSTYTHYTSDSSSYIDEESNQQAYMDFHKMLKRSNSMESQPDDPVVNLPKTVTFIPKRKTGDATMIKNCTELKQNQNDVGKESSMQGRGLPISIAAADANDSEVCAMEEDEPETVADRQNSMKPSRYFRTTGRLELDKSVD